MKLKTNRYCAVLLALAFLPLVGCSYFNSKAEKVQPTTREQQCSDLKSTLTYNKPYELGKQNPTQQAEAMQLYNKYDCPKFEKNAQQQN